MSPSRRAWLVVLCAGLGLVCYYLPWFAHKTAGFTMNAFDLAEWASLHPATRSSSPPMLTSVLLRLPHVLLPFAAALASNALRDPRARWVLRAVALLALVRMVPPVEFFRGETSDPNYRQMALLTVLGAALVAGSVFMRADRLWRGLSAASFAVSVIAGGWGLSRAGVLLDNFQIDVHIGAGAYGLALAVLAGALAALWPVMTARGTQATAREIRASRPA